MAFPLNFGDKFSVQSYLHATFLGLFRVDRVESEVPTRVDFMTGKIRWLWGDLSGDDGWLGAALASARRLVAQAARCLVSTETCTFRKSFLFTLAGFASRLACSDIGLRRCRWEAFRAPFAGAAPGRTLLAARPWAPLCPSAQPYGRASCSPKNSRSAQPLSDRMN